MGPVLRCVAPVAGVYQFPEFSRTEGSEAAPPFSSWRRIFLTKCEVAHTQRRRKARSSPENSSRRGGAGAFAEGRCLRAGYTPSRRHEVERRRFKSAAIAVAPQG